MFSGIKLFSGSANPGLAASIADYMQVPLGRAKLSCFSDGETQVEIGENVRGRDIFLIQPTCAPANDSLMELLIMADACKRASAGRITAVIPYYGYARQDRKAAPRAPISAKLVADLLSAAGLDRVLTMELHAGQIQGFFDIPTDNLFAAPIFENDIKANFSGEPLMVISPDVGGVVRARALARRINADLAIVDKRRERAGESEVMNIIGDVSGRVCILVDDIVDSAGTLCNAAEALMQKGAKATYAYATHGVLSGGAVARVRNSALKALVITDSISPSEAVRGCSNIRILPTAELLGEAIKRIAEERSVSSLFD
jgi:ribose-phosphate pyrophosphokinase